MFTFVCVILAKEEEKCESLSSLNASMVKMRGVESRSEIQYGEDILVLLPLTKHLAKSGFTKGLPPADRYAEEKPYANTVSLSFAEDFFFIPMTSTTRNVSSGPSARVTCPRRRLSRSL